jgi:hypothetical protein
MIDEADLRWDGEALAIPRPSVPTVSEPLSIEQIPFNPAFLTIADDLELSVRTANCFRNDKSSSSIAQHAA